MASVTQIYSEQYCLLNQDTEKFFSIFVVMGLLICRIYWTMCWSCKDILQNRNM